MKNYVKKYLALPLVLMLAVAGCGLSPAPKPETGPAGKPADPKVNPPLSERFQPPPAQFYDLESIAGTTFDGISRGNWLQTENGLSKLRTVWQQAKAGSGEMKQVKECDEALDKLIAGINDKSATKSYENLNKFMDSVGNLGKAYKLSPLTDIITVSNAIRNVCFYVETGDWLKAGAKAKELDDTWGRAKPALEQVGILGEVTKTHSYVRQLRDAVAAENKGAARARIGDLNRSVGLIREYYRGR